MKTSYYPQLLGQSDKVIMQSVHNRKEMEEYIEFMSERAQIEEQYCKSLQKLLTNLQRSNVSKFRDALQNQLKNKIDIISNFTEVIKTEIIQYCKELINNQNNLSRRVIDDLRVLDWDLQDRQDDLMNAKLDYKIARREAEQSQIIDIIYEYSREITEEKLQKQQQKTIGLLQESQRLEKEYHMMNLQYNEFMDVYNIKAENFFQQLSGQELERNLVVKETLMKLLMFEIQISKQNQHDSEKINESVRSYNIQDSLDRFIATNTRLQEVPISQEFQQYKTFLTQSLDNITNKQYSSNQLNIKSRYDQFLQLYDDIKDLDDFQLPAENPGEHDIAIIFKIIQWHLKQIWDGKDSQYEAYVLNLISVNQINRLLWVQALETVATKKNYQLQKTEQFEQLSKNIWQFLQVCGKSLDATPVRRLMVLSSIIYIQENQKRYFLANNLKEQKILFAGDFIEACIVESIYDALLEDIPAGLDDDDTIIKQKQHIYTQLQTVCFLLLRYNPKTIMRIYAENYLRLNEIIGDAYQRLFKEKDYEFTYKSRIVVTTQTSDNPLRPDRPKVQVQRGRKQNIQIKTKGNYVDPLSRTQQQPIKNDPLARPNPTNNPLARPQTIDPLARQQKPKQQEQEQPSKSVDQRLIIQQDTDAKQVETEEKKKMKSELSIYWNEIREDYVKVFKIKEYNLDQNITNPFGNQVQGLNVHDGQPRSAYSGDNKIEYQQQANRQGQLKQILQRAYVQKLLDIRRDLRKHWLNQDKVASLQLAIQSCKLLIDNEKPLFAPIKYIHVIDVLETFGKFVVERLLKLSYPNYTDQKISELSLQQVVGSNISEIASEIGRNWLIKIGSIRELIPRLYIEATLLKVHFFIDHTQIKPIFYRLIKNVRAIGDYINAMYFATYLFRIGAELFSGEKDYLLTTLRDFFKYMNQKGRFGRTDLPQEQYIVLFEPCLAQLFRMYSQNCTDREFRELFEYYRTSNQNHLLLRKIIDEFQAVHICALALELFSIMQGYQVEIKYQLYASFLPKIAKGLTNKTAGIEICELVLQDCMHIKQFGLFLDILASLIDLIFRSFQGFQRNQFFFQILQRFNDLFASVEKDTFVENKELFIKLHQFILRVFNDAEDVTEILQIDTFITCIQYFPLDMKRLVSIDILKLIMQKSEKFTDQVSLHSILSIAKNLNYKNINIDDQRELSKIISQFLTKIDLGKDFEQTLNLYADVRAHFGNVSQVSGQLINRATELIIKAKKYAKGKNEWKVLQFLQACLAYCYITIPTIDNSIQKLKSYLQVGQVGLSIGLISQSEAVFQTAVETLLELPELNNNQIVDNQVTPIISELISWMIVIPDDPQADYLLLYQGFMAAVDQVKWNTKNGQINKFLIYVNGLQYLSAQIQERLPYHFENVQSNDKLYSKDVNFRAKIVELVQEEYVKVGQLASEIPKLQGDNNDIIYVIRILLHAINRLNICFRINPSNCNPLIQLVEAVTKKIIDLNKERSGKTLIAPLKSYILSTYILVEKICQSDKVSAERQQIIKSLDVK
ncbi:hypothetical protein pb186bvf_006615 [Paramecium bursaria]